MDDLLAEFLIESNEHLDTIDSELVRFEQDPNNKAILSNIFRLVHTIKGTCGFLGLGRLEALAHAAETLMGKYRDGCPVTSDGVSLILVTIDKIKDLLGALERDGTEPVGSDDELIGRLDAMSAAAEHVAEEITQPAQPASVRAERPLKPGEVPLDELERIFQAAPGPEDVGPVASGETVATKAGRTLKPGEVPLDELERIFQAAAGPDQPAVVPGPAATERKDTPPKSKGTGEGEEAGEGHGSKVQTIRVNVDTLEHLMTMVSELVLTRNQLLEIARRSEDSAYKVPLQRLSHVTAELQDSVMKTRMQPIGNAWQKLPRVIRDLSSELRKKIDLVLQGAETELDRQVLEVIKDPLTHMVRNSADHGIETPEERKAAGKPEKGTIKLNAYHEGGTITIEISDDGKGLNLAVIRKKAVERGIASEAEVERMSDAQVAKFIFHPGFSTAQVVTSVSGRGVGMDVVKTNIELIGGTVDIRTEMGKGTTFSIKIPLTLAIVAALIVSCRDQRYAIPQIAVQELVRVSPGTEHSIERINDTPVLRLRDNLLPVIRFSRILGAEDEGSGDEGFVVVTETGEHRFGILVDGVFHTEEIVVKPMSSKLRDIQLFSGNTILGDGAVVLIIDPNELARSVGSESSETDRRKELTSVSIGKAGDETTTLLVFRGGGDSLKAVPLSLVTRLEEIDASSIEWIGGHPVIQYRGRLMPLVASDESLIIRQEGKQSLLVFSDGELHMGLAVSEIVDIVEDRFDIELVADRSDLVGTAVIKGKATEVVNVGHYIPLVAEAWSRTSSKRKGPARSVLLVDGSSFFRNVLTPVLATAGYRVHVAGSAGEALSQLAAGLHPDVVVTDLDLPDQSGLRFVESLRSDPNRATMAVIGLSEDHDPALVTAARRLRVSDVVAKTDRRGLIAALNEAVSPIERAA